ncbi:MAG: hypothetical protein QOJ62_3035 [Actinomycetota bacterium]|jgi:hypothetical protein|nr:hypothetical protein [Actinomycetota bacterium]
MSELDAWVTAVSEELGLDPALVPDLVLDVARDVAHGVGRPAAPLTTFLLGRAVAAGIPVEEAAERISRLAASWDYQEDEPTP